jgi:hypothetical protein
MICSVWILVWTVSLSTVVPVDVADIDIVLDALATPYEFQIPTFIQQVKMADHLSIENREKPPPYPFSMPNIRLTGQFSHPELRINSEQFVLQDFIPSKTKGATERFPHKDQLYKGFFDLSNSAKEKMEAARANGQDSWRFDGHDKVVEVFFRVDFSTLKTGTSATSMEEALSMSDQFEEILQGKSYLALDCHGVPLVVLYVDPYQKAWGTNMGNYIVKTTTENIDKLARFVQPPPPKDARRHGMYNNWIAESQGQPWANGPGARSGVYYFGMWREMGHNTLAVLTKDMEGRGAYANAMVRALQLWCGNITQTIETCFAGIDAATRDAYRAAYKGIQHEATKQASQTMVDDLFPFRALLVNVLTEPHMDQKDWKNGWAWLTPFGKFDGGLLCVTLLKRKFNFQPGMVVGIRGEKLEHFTTKWNGTNRYSWVFSFHQTVREERG